MDSNIWKIKSWIKQIHPHIDDISPELDLIEQRLIDSLRFVDLVLLIQHLSGLTIDIATIDINQIRSLNAIKQAFFYDSLEV